mmetsp:Transcript_11591/g.35426  ORF Transcript_11591/g.35426 Transcript_11591/m.35426 type:complete len:411 (+) Transcript_11591:145-1377(+)
MENYIKYAVVGTGTYGTVYEAKDKRSGERVALKKIRTQTEDASDGVHFSVLREVKLLQEMRHRHVVSLRDVFIHHGNIFMAVEFLVTDLEVVIRDPRIILTEAHIKTYMSALLEGVAYCHRNWVLHRDLKPNNLLIGADGVLKIIDFGLARLYNPEDNLSPEVVTRWYRAPELLFTSRRYSFGVDMWAVGCILAELLQGKPYLAGLSDIDQLSKIFAALGTPTEEEWPGLSSLPGYMPFTKQATVPLAAQFRAASPEAVDLLSALIAFYPPSRLSAEDALKHPFFSTGAPPTPPALLPLPAAVKRQLAAEEQQKQQQQQLQQQLQMQQQQQQQQEEHEPQQTTSVDSSASHSSSASSAASSSSPSSSSSTSAASSSSSSSTLGKRRRDSEEEEEEEEADTAMETDELEKS